MAMWAPDMWTPDMWQPNMWEGGGLVGTPPNILTTTLPDGVVGVTYGATLNASGSLPIVWSIIAGSPPGGVGFSPDGVFLGVPGESGTFPMTINAENAAGSDTQALTLTVNPGFPSDETVAGPGGRGHLFDWLKYWPDD